MIKPVTFCLTLFCMTIGGLSAETSDNAAIIEVVDRAYVQ